MHGIDGFCLCQIVRSVCAIWMYGFGWSLLLAIEDELARLKAQIRRNGSKPQKLGWRATFGSFADDPLYIEAMRLGRKYRESTRPKSKRR